METYDPGDLRFDQHHIFYVLEHPYDPLAALFQLRSWLKPDGRLVVEVPDVSPTRNVGYRCALRY